MSDFNNINGGLKIPSQIPLDVKTFILNEAALTNLGVNNNLAFTYYDNLKVYCFQEKTTYVWDEVQIGDHRTGLLSSNFTYPSNIITFGINYSNKKYNFFPVVLITADNLLAEIGTLPAGATGTPGTIWTSGTIAPVNTVGINGDYYLNNTTGDYYKKISGTYIFQGNLKGPTGLDGLDGTNGTNGVNYTSNNLQKIIIYPTNFISGNYTLLNGDNNYSIIVDNGATNVTITVPTGLSSAFVAGFTQKGNGKVTFTTSSTTINTPIGLSIKGQNYATAIEQIGTTNVFNLLGNSKV